MSVDFGNWQAYSILIVDDEAGMRSFLERALKPAARASSAPAAWRRRPVRCPGCTST